ncbi:DUF732 domain-containing protein, partial [Microbacterium testaceum]
GWEGVVAGMVCGMKRAVVPAGVLVLLLALAGCVSVETSESRIEVTPGASGTFSDGDTTVVVEPLTAETPTSIPNASTPEASFLVKIREVLPDDTSIPNATDAQLLAAAQEACEQMAAGTDSTEVSVIDGEQADGLGVYRDSARIGAVAKQTICAP